MPEDALRSLLGPTLGPNVHTMNTSATPRRITIGFVVVILLSMLLGLWSVWQILGINRNVVQLATNSVPSVVTLNKIIQANAAAS
jgi:CHASE3 domain sensor protein